MKNPALFLLLAFLILSCNSTEPKASGTTENIPSSETAQVSLKLSCSDFNKAMTTEGAQLIDVRTPEEVADGFIQGAVNIDFYSDNFEEEILKLDKNKPVLLYCRSGGRSGNATKLLSKAQFKEIYDLDGGYTAWVKEK